jgi:hypothetical protein
VCSNEPEDVRRGALALMKATLNNYWIPLEGCVAIRFASYELIIRQYSISNEEKGEIRRDLFMLLIQFVDHKVFDCQLSNSF